MEVEPEPNALFSFSPPLNGNNVPQRPPGFGLIIPGAPVRTDFQSLTPTQYSLALSSPQDLPVSLLRSVTDIVLFCTDASSSTIPPDCGVLCYWQLSCATESTGFSLLGALAPGTSELFRTGWSEHEAVAAILQQQQQSTVVLTIGLSVEPLSQVQNVAAASNSTTDQRLQVAQHIALDLFRFMQSFDTGGGSGPQQQLMTVPKNIFDRWYQRFENRFRRDPNFFLKPAD